MTFVNICHRIAQLQMLYSVTLTYFFQGQIFQMLMSQKRWELAHKYAIQLLLIFIFSVEWRDFESSTRWPWPTFQGQIFKLLITQKRLKLVPKIRLLNIFHICRRMETLRKLYSQTLTYIFLVKIVKSLKAVPADLPPLVRCTRRRVALVLGGQQQRSYRTVYASLRNASHNNSIVDIMFTLELIFMLYWISARILVGDESLSPSRLQVRRLFTCNVNAMNVQLVYTCPQPTPRNMYKL